MARSGGELDIRAVADREVESGIVEGELLLDFADALVGRDESLPGQRDRLVDRLGGAALVDASGIVANFQRMVRIADGTGIPLDEGMREESRELSGVLGLGRFASAANTPSHT